MDPICLVLGSLPSCQDEETSHRFSQSVAQVSGNRLLSPVKTLEQLGFFTLHLSHLALLESRGKSADPILQREEFLKEVLLFPSGM